MKRLAMLLLLAVCCLSAGAQKGGTTRRKPATTARKTAPKTTAAKPKTTTAKPKAAAAQAKQPSVQGLKEQKARVARERAANQKRKAELERSVKQGLENLMTLDTEIAHKRRVIDTIRQDIGQLDRHILLLDSQLVVLEAELAERRNSYMKSMRYMHRNRSVQNQLMFVFSADNFNQMYRRMRFNREYASYQKAQGEAVISKQGQVTAAREELARSRQTMASLLARGQREEEQLQDRQTQQQTQVAQLRKQQKTVQALIEQQQRQEAELNARIDRLIAEELAREKARREAEARKRAEAEAARKKAEEQARRQPARPAKPDKPRTTNTRERKATAKAADTYAVPAEDRKLSGSFVSNKGRLPMPITGGYQLVRGFGLYTPEGTNVQLRSNGWHLKGRPGAKVQCIFDGKVSAVYYQGDSYIVVVRHGTYISAYINLASVSVKKDQNVSARQVLGSLGGDLTMQFQLRNWDQLVNPSGWFAR